MAFESSLPRVRPDWILEFYWPQFNRADGFTGSAGLVVSPDDAMWRGALPVNSLLGQNYNPASVIGNGINGGAPSSIEWVPLISGPSGASHAGPVAQYNTTTVVGQSWRLPIWPVLRDPTSLDSWQAPEWQRCIWLQEVWSPGPFGTMPFDSLNGTLMSPRAPLDWAWSNTFDVGAYTFFGWEGDGAGGVQYVSYDASGTGNLLEAVPFAHQDWNLTEWILVGAANGRPATLTFRANGAVVAHREFGSAVLPFPPQDHWRVDVLTEARGLTAKWYQASLRCRWGAQTPDGLQLSA